MRVAYWWIKNGKCVFLVRHYFSQLPLKKLVGQIEILNMSIKSNYQIDEVLDLEDGRIIYSKDFFEKSLEEIHQVRSKLQEVIQGLRKPFYVCLYCKQKVRIRGSIQRDFTKGRRKYHFAHLKDSIECPFKTESGLTKEEINRLKYNGEKESQLHIELKNKISEFLKLNKKLSRKISDIRVEKIIRAVISKEWKKPDIQFYYGKEKIALELQLSTTWLDVITKRQNFYKQNGIFILWVFNKFNIEDEQRRMTDNDVIYTNNQNAFVFDEETILESLKEKELVLKCYFKNYSVLFDEITEIWEQRFVKLSDLTFVQDHMKVFYFDSKSALEKAQIEVKEFSSDNKNEPTENKIEKLTHQQSLSRGEKLDYNLISELYTSLSKANRQIGEVEEKLKTYQYVNENITEFTKNVFMWLLDEESLNRICPNKFYIEIREHFGTILKDIQTKKQEIEKKKKGFERKTENINSLPSINEVQPELKIVSQLKHKELFDSKLTEIGSIQNNLISPLFGEKEIKWLKSEEEYHTVKYKQGTSFVFNFALKLKEYQNKTMQINEELQVIENSLSETKYKMNAYIFSFIERDNMRLNKELALLEQKRKKVLEDLEKAQYKN